ncbi:ABC transporter ATP-binding protein/permease [Macrococcus carouselicus]|uniref:ATP-binding cassette domain-containing protein n=1 Tax=Macrococcus carouselicus TaxID=69969 RepID=A0A9Q8CIW6_9STAP|nr:ABC transporter transmembrane domain-containing protein [Macrococcus carouselicus]TDM03625.1 ATP-binding cassette domain-containing protein [Macrococcus carouselicus]
MKYLTSLTRRYFYIHVLLLMTAASLAVIIILQSINIGRLIDGVIQQQIPYQLLGLILAILIGRSILQFLLKCLGAGLSNRIKHDMRTSLMKERRDTASTLNLSTEGIEGIDSFYADYIPQLYRSSLIPLAIILFLLFFHRNAAFIMMITAPFIPLFYIIIGINTANKATAQMTALNQFSGYFLDAIRGIVTIKLFNNEKRVRKGIADKSEGFREKTMIILKTAFLSTLMIEFIAMLSIGIIALEVGLGLIVFKTVTFYTAIVVLMLAPEFYNALKDLGAAFHTGKQAEGYAELLDNSEEEIIDRQYDTQAYIDLDFTKTYENFSMRVHDRLPLRHTVIFGPSGAGKTTFTKILAGIDRQGHGKLVIPAQLENNIIYMSQQPFVMSDTIRNNITMFGDIEESKLMAAARKVDMLDRIQALPDGFETMIGSAGEQLSGGELHRIMLMRAILHPAALVILDEPTAMLDAKTASIVKETIAELSRESVIFTIAHQRSTILSADYLILMGDGQLKHGTDEDFRENEFYQAVMTHV